ncbi:hypothetical protein RH858_09320 [Halalkaliarchaeum sp. AArc-GB]|nr:hypothetical protein [Halalkaliarchaeum sp. AArc-GB]MDR5673345.1 hypothetical protein [Halalkaliarchaeum sp. AArc-GB]
MLVHVVGCLEQHRLVFRDRRYLEGVTERRHPIELEPVGDQQ